MMANYNAYVTEFPVLNPDHRRSLLPINIAIFPKEGEMTIPIQ